MTNTQARAAREAAGLSIEALAKRAGVSRSLVAFHEHGLQVSAKSRLAITAALAAALAEQSRAVARARRQVARAAAQTPAA